MIIKAVLVLVVPAAKALRTVSERPRGNYLLLLRMLIASLGHGTDVIITLPRHKELKKITRSQILRWHPIY